MVKYLNIVLLCVLFVSCKQQQPVTQVPVVTVERIVERQVPIVLPQDSSYITALFECDSNNRVILQQLHEQKTSGVSSSYTLNNGFFAYKTNIIRDTIYVVARDTIITREKPIQVIQEVYTLSPTQRVFVWIGIVFLLFVVSKLIRLFI